MAYTGEAGRLTRNCCASVGGFSRAGGDGGCVASLSVVLVRSFWLCTLRLISGGAMPDST